MLKEGNMIDKNKTGLALGLFFAIVHAIWALSVALMPNTLQSFLDWIFNLHSLEPVWILISFNLLNSLFLIGVTFVSGYLFGWVFAWAHELIHKKR